VLAWRKRLWRCREPACRVRTWTEQAAAIHARAVLTQRARAEACRRVGKDAHAVAAVTRDLGVGWATVMRAVHEHGTQLVDDPARLDGVATLGLDETSFLKATRLAPTRYVTGLVDLEQGRLLDVVADRTRAAVDRWLHAGLAAGDPGGEVVAAWQGKELLRAVYAASDLAHARAALERFYRWADGVGVAELSRLAGTVRAWEAEILAFHATDGCSNGPTEAVNLLVKKVKRVGHGFRNFTNYRLRLLLHCGVSWQTHRTARLRGRSLRLVASSPITFCGGESRSGRGEARRRAVQTTWIYPSYQMNALDKMNRGEHDYAPVAGRSMRPPGEAAGGVGQDASSACRHCGGPDHGAGGRLAGGRRGCPAVTD
jgi:hypothetical protein